VQPSPVFGSQIRVGRVGDLLLFRSSREVKSRLTLGFSFDLSRVIAVYRTPAHPWLKKATTYLDSCEEDGQVSVDRFLVATPSSNPI
jgi:hypothetical protein